MKTKKFLLTLGILALIAIPTLSSASQKATLFNPIDGQRKVVQVGQAGVFDGGWKLETPENNYVSYWVRRLTDDNADPIKDWELELIPEEAWYQITPEIYNTIPQEEILGSNQPRVIDISICRGDDCIRFQENELLGYSVVSRYRTRLSSSMTSTQSTVPVSSMATFDGHTLTMADLGSKVYLTIEPGTNREEIVKCTSISSSSWATCTRGLAFYGTTETSVAANREAHNAGSIVVMSNVHYVYEQLTDKDADETIGGIKTYTWPPLITNQPTSTGQVATWDYVNDVGAGGFTASNIGTGLTLRANGTAPETMDINTSTSAWSTAFSINSGGFFDLATSTIHNFDTAILGLKDFGDYYFASSTGDRYISNSTSTEDVSSYLFYNQYIYTRGASTWATTTPTDLMSVWNIASSTNMLYTASAYSWSEDNTYPDTTGWNSGTVLDDMFNDRYNATTTKNSDFTFSDDLNVTGNATSSNLTFTNNLLRGNALVNLFGGNGVDGALNITTGTTTIDFANATTTIKQYTSINIADSSGLTISNQDDEGGILILRSQGDCTIGGYIDLSGKGATAGLTGNGRAGSEVYNAIYESKGLYTTANPDSLYRRSIIISAGGGGANGAGTYKGAGGNGGGALLIECAGTLTFTGSISVDGNDGVDATGSAGGPGSGGGGGGAAGMSLILYNILGTNTGSVVANGGDGGNGGDDNGGSGAGAGGGAGGGCWASAGGAGGASDSAGGDSVGACGAGGGGGSTVGSSPAGAGGTNSGDGVQHYTEILNTTF